MSTFQPTQPTDAFGLEASNFQVQPVTDSETLQQLKTVVRMAAGNLSSGNPIGTERRANPRVAFPFPVEIQVPASAVENEQDNEQAVIGRFLSCYGFDFYHKDPLPHPIYRMVIPCMGQSIEVMLKIGWTRSSGLGWMESGGKFLGV